MKYSKKYLWLSVALFCLHAASAWADTFGHGRVHRKLETADLVAEVLIVGRSAHAHAVHHTVTHSEASIERILDTRSTALRDLRTGDRITIESPGGERGGVGVHISGYPRPYMGQRYMAYLNRTSSGVYVVAGFHHGLEPLEGQRAYSRNRTDGTNGEGNGAYLRWDGEYLPIPYFIDAESFRDRGDFIPAIDAAFQSWRAPKDIKVEFTAVGCTNNSRVDNDGINNVILLRSGWTFDTDAIAINRSFYVAGSEPRAGLILDSDIILNGQSHRFTTTNEAGAHDVQNIVTHEVGHLLGLGHEITPQDNNSAMFPFANPNETNKRTLSANDLAGVREIYTGTGTKLQAPSTMEMCSIPSGQRGCSAAACPAGMTMTFGHALAAMLQYLLLLTGLPLGRLLSRRWS